MQPHPVESRLLLAMDAQARAGGTIYQVVAIVGEHGFGKGFNQLSPVDVNP